MATKTDPVTIEEVRARVVPPTEKKKPTYKSPLTYEPWKFNLAHPADTIVAGLVLIISFVTFGSMSSDVTEANERNTRDYELAVSSLPEAQKEWQNKEYAYLEQWQTFKKGVCTDVPQCTYLSILKQPIYSSQDIMVLAALEGTLKLDNIPATTFKTCTKPAHLCVFIDLAKKSVRTEREQLLFEALTGRHVETIKKLFPLGISSAKISFALLRNFQNGKIPIPEFWLSKPQIPEKPQPQKLEFNFLVCGILFWVLPIIAWCTADANNEKVTQVLNPANVIPITFLWLPLKTWILVPWAWNGLRVLWARYRFKKKLAAHEAEVATKTSEYQHRLTAAEREFYGKLDEEILTTYQRCHDEYNTLTGKIADTNDPQLRVEFEASKTLCYTRMKELLELQRLQTETLKRLDNEVILEAVKRQMNETGKEIEWLRTKTKAGTDFVDSAQRNVNGTIAAQ